MTPQPTNHKPKRRIVDVHTQNASKVAEHEYFVITKVSDNENPGLLVGTEVKKHSEPEPRESKYWKKNLYWSVVVFCPNGETRRVSCDALTPRKDKTRFQFQELVYRRSMRDMNG